MSGYQRERLDAETAEERAARLQRMSGYQRERLDAETAEERAARLQRMSGYTSMGDWLPRQLRRGRPGYRG